MRVSCAGALRATCDHLGKCSSGTRRQPPRQRKPARVSFLDRSARVLCHDPRALGADEGSGSWPSTALARWSPTASRALAREAPSRRHPPMPRPMRLGPRPRCQESHLYGPTRPPHGGGPSEPVGARLPPARPLPHPEPPSGGSPDWRAGVRVAGGTPRQAPHSLPPPAGATARQARRSSRRPVPPRRVPPRRRSCPTDLTVRARRVKIPAKPVVSVAASSTGEGSCLGLLGPR